MVALPASLTTARKIASKLAATLGDYRRGLRRASFRQSIVAELGLAPDAVRRALPWLVRARSGADRSLIRAVIANAAAAPDDLAVEMGDERLNWADLDAQTSRLAHVLTDLGVRTGDVVALFGANSPFYLVALLGASRVGATVALINSHLEALPLEHAVRSSGARIVLSDEGLAARFAPLTGLAVRVFTFPGGELAQRLAAATTRPFPRAKVTTESDFVYIYTSGTTGLPKPCKVSHGRTLVIGALLGTLVFRYRPGDKLYCVLPLYHTSALLLGFSACVLTRTPIALRDHFSARAFWPDVQRYGATAVLYIGELCRYLLNAPPSEAEKYNPVRVAVGNGLRADLWDAFAKRFEIASVHEFYGSTEGPGGIFNVTGRSGSVGRLPFRRLLPFHLVRYDVERDEHVRGADGFMIECGPNEVGELLVALPEKPLTALTEFKGYTDEAASRRKILTDVFERGDRYYRSGDLLRFDDDDYFYFVDRIGETFRWKGENVSTAEVAEVIARAEGVREAAVLGVKVPGAEGRAGLAALVCDGAFDAGAFHRASQDLPDYAQVRFVRVMRQLATTSTFKIIKSRIDAEGIDPATGEFWLRTEGGYVPLTSELWAGVQAGSVRL